MHNVQRNWQKHCNTFHTNSTICVVHVFAALLLSYWRCYSCFCVFVTSRRRHVQATQILTYLECNVYKEEFVVVVLNHLSGYLRWLWAGQSCSTLVGLRCIHDFKTTRFSHIKVTIWFSLTACKSNGSKICL